MSPVSLDVHDRLAPSVASNCATGILSVLVTGLLSSLKRLLVDPIRRLTRDKPRLAGFALLAIATHAYYRHKYSFWSRRNVKTPTPIPVLGNFLSFYRQPRERLELEWPRKYGKIYGYYMGKKPYLVVADASIIKRISIKDFDKFPNRFLLGVKNKYQKHFLSVQKDAHWRGMRAIMTPTFTSGKMRTTFKIFEMCAEDLVREHERRLKASESGMITVDTKRLMAAFAMGSAVSSFYGLQLKSADDSVPAIGNTREEFADRSLKAFKQSSIRLVAASLLPQSLLEFLNIPQFSEKDMDFFAERAHKIIEHRQKEHSQGRRYNDFLQLLLDAKSDEKIDLAESDRHERHHALIEDADGGSGGADATHQWRPSRMRLSEMEVLCQTMVLMMTATETTSVLLANTLFILSYHADIQETLYKALIEIRSESGKFDYDQLASCVYLDCVVSESLRLMAPAISLDRVASEDYFIPEYNVLVPKSTVVFVAIHAVHRDPDYWPEPDKFDPDRFRPENAHKIVPGSYCPFGMGPRTCIGFRFALTEAKLALAKLVTEFRFERAPGTKYPPEPRRPTFVINEHTNLFVAVRRRNY